MAKTFWHILVVNAARMLEDGMSATWFGDAARCMQISEGLRITHTKVCTTWFDRVDNMLSRYVGGVSGFWP